MKPPYLNPFFAIITLLLPFTINAQESEYISYKWSDHPTYETPMVNGNQNTIGVLSKTGFEFVLENREFKQYELTHSVSFIASQAGIEENNKVYVPLRREAEVVFQRIRVITQKGKLIVLDESNIQEGFDEESGFTFKYYAVEGLEVGSFLEINQLLKGPANYNGVRYPLQNFNFQKKVEFELISPVFLNFSFKSINGLSDVVKDSTYQGKNRWFLNVDSMAGYKEEPVSFSVANSMSILFKLSGNLAVGTLGQASYASTANGYFRFLYQNIEKGDLKAIDKLLKEINLDKSQNDEIRIRILENYLKKNFGIYPFVDRTQSGIAAFIKNKAGDESSLVKLYANAFKKLNIEHEVVLTSDRTVLKFDQEYEAMNFLTSVLFYFPKLDLYLSPTSAELRLGFIPWENTANYGLFIEPLEIEDVTTGIAKVKLIPALDYTRSQFNHRVIVDFSNDVSKPEIDFTAELSGYHAAAIQTSYSLIGDEIKEKFNDQLKQTFTNEKVEEKLLVENADPLKFGKEPLKLKLKSHFSSFTETAGNKIIFKVGELIGEQTEMYHEKKRVHDIENDFNRSYYRTIEIKLPEEYSVENIEKLNMNVSIADQSALFKSSSYLKDNLLHIDIEEYYNKIYYPASEFGTYQKVINAAADFNKLAIILNKK